MTDNNEYKSNDTLIFITIFFSIFLIIVIGIFVYDLFVNGSIEEQSNKYNNIVENKEDNIIINLEDTNLENIKIRLEDSFFLDLIISRKNLNEINNNDLLYYLIKLTESQSQFGKVDNVPIKIIEDIHKDSLLSNINFIHSDINIDIKLLWVYNKESNIYIKNNINKDNIIIPIFIKLDNVKKENNKYILSYKYGFKNINDNNIYGSYEDSLNKINSIYFDNSNNIEVLKQELNNNFNNIKDKLKTYNYVVENINNQYILKEFYIN